MWKTDADSVVKSIMRFTVEVNFFVFFTVPASVGSGVSASVRKGTQINSPSYYQTKDAGRKDLRSERISCSFHYTTDKNSKRI